ncbi:MAG: diguanylate cyclase (GGDEF)-like protein [Candidatus Azotimanducaceae bacterium]|jgi:diguanylate cyclase (GGDEF)-like protein
MSAVLSLPPGFQVYFNLENAVLRDEVSKLPFVNPVQSEKNVEILIIDSLHLAEGINPRHLILIDTSCAPKAVSENTFLFSIHIEDKWGPELLGLVSALSQGHGPSVLKAQAKYKSQLDSITCSLEETIIWTNEKFEIISFTDNAAALFKLDMGQIQGSKLQEIVQCEEEDLCALLTKRASVNASEKLGVSGVLKNGDKLYLNIGIKSNGVRRYQLNLVDVSLQRAADKRFIKLANYDPVTGLANRGLLFEFLQRAINRSKQSGRLVALLILNLNHFNRIDDETGIQLSDEVLKTAADRLKFLLHNNDMLARWGGDELALVMEDLKYVDSISRIAEKIVSVYSNPFVIDGHDYYVTPSIGIAVYPEADDTINGLIQAADTAMYEAKTLGGRNTYRFYQSQLQEDAEERASIERQLSRALDHKEFELYYQPKVSIQGERVVGFEALLRWNHPDWRDVSPEKFIPIAEESGLIKPIGDWVLRQACVQMGIWIDKFPQMRDCSIAVNVSPKQLNDPYLPGRIAVILADSRLDAARLEIEITESAIMDNPDQTIDILRKIHELGIKISIDDFGTGYSSLSYLSKMPIDCVKIDRSFVIDIGLNNSTESIIQAILVMSSELGLTNVAEGIETVEQMAFFRRTNCDVLQGYMFSKPRSEVDIDALFLGEYPALHQELSQLEINRLRPQT